MKIEIRAFSVIALVISSTAYADEALFSERLCEKMQSCSVQQMKEDGAPEQMIEMVQGMFAQQCASINEIYGMATKANGLYEKAKKCTETREAMSCDDLLNNNESPECKEFEEAVNNSAFSKVGG